MVQFFKETDDLEKKFYEITAPSMDALEAQLNAFFDEAYACYLLGEVLYDTGASSISSAMTRDVFRTAFFALFESFVEGGSLESYMIVFRAIFGEDVSVVFDIPAPGHLTINIDALNITEEPFTMRRIVDNVYQYEDLLDSEGEPIMAQVTKGIKTQQDMDILMPEITPAGIFVETTLIIT
ncbi:hypothetical protein MAC3UK_0033 [Bdellovibrio phage MAC3UK]|nr:hypothetical protein MAC3UK_0033 [Bdellovibrio phage MAC3UK]